MTSGIGCLVKLNNSSIEIHNLGNVYDKLPYISAAHNKSYAKGLNTPTSLISNIIIRKDQFL